MSSSEGEYTYVIKNSLEKTFYKCNDFSDLENYIVECIVDYPWKFLNGELSFKLQTDGMTYSFSSISPNTPFSIRLSQGKALSDFKESLLDFEVSNNLDRISFASDQIVVDIDYSSIK